MRPNHHQFVAFAYVVREGSFSAAAARLGVTQSTVTQHVANLEQGVGAQLLLRGRDGVEVTPTGRELYDLADRLVAVDRALAERLEGFASMRAGRLKVIANAPQPALRIIAAFTARFPEIRIEFGLHDWTTATGMIRSRMADVGLITEAPEHDDWERLCLESTRYVLYCRADSPLAGAGPLRLADLGGQTMILPEPGSLTERLVSARLRAEGLRFARQVTMTTFPVMCEAVLQGVGVAIFLQNSSLIRDGLAQVELVDFAGPQQTWLVATRDRARLRLIAEFTACALAAGA
ncbi:LysR family transcriptional regulator [Ruegeria pomeroyi]|uniref:Transcriptional regulator, LysR family n=2 Tax=Ruegeria pomeroyi TaxID=89184 RepID=Q5LSE4_RUEPO|nr:LysR family transcriptional regulator [Ruegeria pomeroyi]AAV95103.1 transcriptional regulator, LysR family [Ruegeria pomeroyi DSS-3]NVK99136.1 LysR family transcriptional regulator [Ruegeria pomeroyi]NVL00800.1 LysR family transcriptional regulator [Ruegeria pomeroyi]QWV08678.1 LysR family transcriptional regulator [Ruegeria pomeroyi]